MTKRLLLLLLILTFFSLSEAPALAKKAPEETGLEKVRVLIKVKRPTKHSKKILSNLGGERITSFNTLPVFAVTIPQKSLESLKRNPLIEIVEPDLKVQAANTETDNSWGVQKINVLPFHQEGLLGQEVKVAVIDSGLDYTHPELRATYAGGYDFANNDPDPQDDFGHGTHVAGIIAAAVNEEGRLGVAPQAKLFALKVLDAQGSGYWSDILSALEWAKDHDIHLANLSLGSSTYPGSIVENSFTKLNQEGMLIIAAAGNNGNPSGTGNNIIYPAKFHSTIAVGAADQTDARAWFSSTGAELDLVAPGVDIFSAQPGDTFAYLSGTSMAAPFVTGAAAILTPLTSDLNGNGVLNDELKQKLLDSVIDLGPQGFDRKYGYGRLNLVLTPSSPPPPDPGDKEPPPTPTATVSQILFSTTQRRGRLKLTLTIKVEDESGKPLPRAKVSFDIIKDGKTIKSRRRRTNTNGEANYSLSRAKNGCYTVVIKNVKASGHPWDQQTPENLYCL